MIVGAGEDPEVMEIMQHVPESLLSHIGTGPEVQLRDETAGSRQVLQAGDRQGSPLQVGVPQLGAVLPYGGANW